MTRPAPTASRLKVMPVTPALWPDLEQLFNDPGGPKSCWCMIWRTCPQQPGLADKDNRKAGLCSRVQAAEQVGLLGYLDGRPVAWCSVAPRESFKPSLAVIDGTAGTWSLTCMYIKRRLRGRGYSAALIDAAIRHARSQGATRLDAYPVAPDAPSYRFCGFTDQFERHGFLRAEAVGSRRTRMTLVLQADPAAKGL